MHQRTLAILEELQRAHWFSRVGVNDTVAAIVLTSWHEAIALRGSAEWQDLRLEMANQYREQLAEQSREHLAKWNDRVNGLKKTLIPFVRRKIEPIEAGIQIATGV